MQKRLLALVATVAMVLSMFAGVAFAVDRNVTPDFVDVAAKRLTDATVELTEDVEFTFAANIANVAEDDLAVIMQGKTLAYKAVADPAKKTVVTVKAGTVLTVDTDTGYALLTACIYNGATERFTPEELVVRPVIGTMLEAPGFTWPVTAAKAKDYTYNGVYLAGKTVALYQDGDVVGDAVTVPPHGVFSVTVDWKDLAPGALYLADVSAPDDPIMLAKGEIKAAELDTYRIGVDRKEAVAGQVQEIKFTVNYKDLAVIPDPQIEITFEDADGNSVNFDMKGDVSYAAGVATVVGELKPAEHLRGTITATVNVMVNGGAAYTNEIDFTVKRKGTVAVTGLPTNGRLTYDVNNNFTPEVLNVDYDTIELLLNGGGFDNETVTPDGTGEFTVKPTEFGDVSAKLIAKKGTKPVYTATYTWKVVGTKVELSHDVLVKGKAVDLVVTVTDQDGKAINNALVTVATEDHSREVDGKAKNIVDGEYKFSFKASDLIINQPGLMKVTVGSIEKNILVLGDEDYTVSMPEAFLRGIDHSEAVSVKEDSTTVGRTSLNFYLQQPDGTIDSVTVSSSSKLAVADDAEVGEYKLYAVNKTNGKYGVATYEVVEPVIELVDAKLTNGVVSVLSFRLLDPTNDNEALDWDVVLAFDSFTDVLSAKQGTASLVVDPLNTVDIIPDADGVYTVTLLLDVDFEDAAKADAVPQVALQVENLVELEAAVEIGEAEFTVTPENPVGDVLSTVVFKLVDANGNGLEGYEISRGDNKLGKTNEDGELEYTARFVDYTTFVVELDEGELELTVRPGADITAPTVEYEEEVDTPQTTIVISDNVRLTRIRINGEEIDFFATDRYEYVANLKPGVNKFRIEVQDSNYNSEVHNIEIVYNAKSTVLEGDKVQRQGEYLFVQLRQFEELGAELAWNQEAKVATFVVGDTKVEVTIGSTTAKVNGEAVTMPVAAYIDAAQGRTYVPVRFVSEALGWNVHWAAGDIVTITLK